MLHAKKPSTALILILVTVLLAAGQTPRLFGQEPRQSKAEGKIILARENAWIQARNHKDAKVRSLF